MPGTTPTPDPRGRGAELALAASAALTGIWLALFFLGHVAGGAIHLLLLGAAGFAVAGARHRTGSASEEREP